VPPNGSPSLTGAATRLDRSHVWGFWLRGGLDLIRACAFSQSRPTERASGGLRVPCRLSAQLRQLVRLRPGGQDERASTGPSRACTVAAHGRWTWASVGG